MVKQTNKKDIRKSILLMPETKKEILIWKSKYGFSSVDSLVGALMRNSERLHDILKKEAEKRYGE